MYWNEIIILLLYYFLFRLHEKRESSLNSLKKILLETFIIFLLFLDIYYLFMLHSNVNQMTYFVSLFLLKKTICNMFHSGYITLGLIAAASEIVCLKKKLLL
jgi:hypothetical protein